MGQPGESPQGTSEPAAWVLHLRAPKQLRGYVITLKRPSRDPFALKTGDGLVLIGDGQVFGIAKVYRVRLEQDTIQIQLVAIQQVTTKVSLPIPESLKKADGVIQHCPWPQFEQLLSWNLITDFAAFTTLEEHRLHHQAHVRELLTTTVIDDLIGPALGPFEIVEGVNVRDRYLVGRLAPKGTGAEVNLEYGDDIAGQDDKNDPNQGEDVGSGPLIIPSSMGLTFCVPAELDQIDVTVTWGAYRRLPQDPKDENPRYAWQRRPMRAKVSIALTERIIPPIQVTPRNPNIFLTGNVVIQKASAYTRNHDTTQGKQPDVKLVSLFLVNGQDKPAKNQDEAWLFQPTIWVREAGGRPVFLRQPAPIDLELDGEEASLAMLYRHHVEFAVGHGVGVHTIAHPKDPSRAVMINTTFMPQQDIKVTETPGLDKADRPVLRQLLRNGLFDMARLADMATPEGVNTLVAALKIFVDDYGNWIKQQAAQGANSLGDYREIGREALARCDLTRQRLLESLAVLRDDPKALAAFQMANRAMADQRIHSQYALARRRGEEATLDAFNQAKNRSWRPFQLAFMLLAIPALADPTHPHRRDLDQAVADLLWFPTGGGKTEAYLGAAAFAMAIRRLHPDLGGLDASQGLSVIMRYTLRLLTLQQFQRATGLICALEVQRQHNPERWGTTPFSIGLWVGGSTTPNSHKDSADYIHAVQRNVKHAKTSPIQLTSCPWCGSPIREDQDVVIDPIRQRTLVYCANEQGDCPFGSDVTRDAAPSAAPDAAPRTGDARTAQTAPNRPFTSGDGIPVLTVDDEIYRQPPSLLVATVDKFAQLAWQNQVRTLFGQVEERCDRHGLIWPNGFCSGKHNPNGDWPATHVQPAMRIRPPDLIIQDEFHLISGPLGTMVALYETAIDQLCSWEYEGHTVIPKVIASTATVRRAPEQIQGVFNRSTMIFPPHGLDVSDNFFAVQRPTAAKPGRRYLGICPMGVSRTTTLSRVYTTMATAAQHLASYVGPLADPYMTVVGYFNSLRDLGGMRRVCDDEVKRRSKRITSGKTQRPGLAKREIRRVKELTSRISNKDIPITLDELEIPFDLPFPHGQPRCNPFDKAQPIDVVLATNMLSVGVDVNRIGLMVVSGQPKTAAEYIQATSRVGRAFPGLVCTVLNWSRPRDLSHYEHFEHFHQTFYQHVEANAVTPFSVRAMDRGLTGVLISMMRQGDVAFNPQLGAGVLNSTTLDRVRAAQDLIVQRAKRVKGRERALLAQDLLEERIALWSERVTIHGGRLAYQTKSKDDLTGLLSKPESGPWDVLTVPNTMREVETPVTLVMNTDRRYSQEPPWQAPDQEDEEAIDG